MAVSDVLWEAVQGIREYQRDGVIATSADPVQFVI
jgi:hypothetical protein